MSLPKPSPRVPEQPELDKALGLVFDEIGRDLVRAHFPVTPMALQPFGIVHGGVYAVMGEAIASFGGHVRVTDDGRKAMGISNATSFIRPVHEGTVHGVGEIRHAGRTLHIWDVEMTDDEGKLCAVSRVTLAIR